jgi:hypothetical protein
MPPPLLVCLFILAALTLRSGATTCDATKKLFVNRACCGGSSNESAICTAPSVDFSPLPHIKNDVQDVKHALEQIMEYEETSSKQEQKFEQELQNITRAQALAELRNERAITELLKLELREAQQLAATNEIKNTTKSIDDKTNKLAAIAQEIAENTGRALSEVNATGVCIALSDPTTLELYKYVQIKEAASKSTRRFKILSTRVNDNATQCWATVQEGGTFREIQLHEHDTTRRSALDSETISFLKQSSMTPDIHSRMYTYTDLMFCKYNKMSNKEKGEFSHLVCTNLLSQETSQRILQDEMHQCNYRINLLLLEMLPLTTKHLDHTTYCS